MWTFGISGTPHLINAAVAFRSRPAIKYGVPEIGFAAAPDTTFRVAGPELVRNRARLAAGVTAELSDTLTLNAGYRGEIAASDRSHNFAANLRRRF